MQSFVAPLMNPLAKGYKKLYDSQKESDALRESKKDEFFGLRDFYRYEFIRSLTLKIKALLYVKSLCLKVVGSNLLYSFH